jgi:hypothetical protein
MSFNKIYYCFWILEPPKISYGSIHGARIERTRQADAEAILGLGLGLL